MTREVSRLRGPWIEPIPDSLGELKWQLRHARIQIMDMHDALHKHIDEIRQMTAATAELEAERGRLRELLGQLIRGVDEKHVFMEGPVVTGVGTPDDLYVGWNWVEEWLHHARSALAKEDTGVMTGCAK